MSVPFSTSSELNATFLALADPTRRQILEHLTHGQSTVGAVAKPCNMSWPAVTKHLKVLEKAGLIERKKQGRQCLLVFRPDPLEAARQWMSFHRHFWESSLDRLAEYLESETSKPASLPEENN